MIGIYCITNTVNGKKYIGQSWDVHARMLRHQSELRDNKHCNKHLQSAWNKYGSGQLVFTVERTLTDGPLTQILLDCIEDSYIKKMHLLNNQFGYNKRGGGSHGKMSDDAKKKMSIASSQRPVNWNAIERMRQVNLVRVISAETRAKQSKASKGRPKSESHKASLAKLRPTPEALAQRTATRKALGHYKWSAESIAKREATKKARRESRNA